MVQEEQNLLGPTELITSYSPLKLFQKPSAFPITSKVSDGKP